MADNVQLPVTGTGTADIVQATDDVSNVHYPIVKLADGTLNSTALIGGDATNGLDVDVTRFSHAQSAASTASWTSGTAQNTALSISVTQYASVLWTTTRDAGTLTDGNYTTEGSIDGGTTWFLVDHIAVRNNWGPVPLFGRSFTENVANSILGYTTNVSNLTNFRLRLDTVIAGTATMSVRIVASTTAAFVLSQNPYDGNHSYAVAGWDDSDNQRVLRVDSTGNLTPGGKDSDGASATVNPILIAGQDGTNVQSLKTDSTGRIEPVHTQSAAATASWTNATAQDTAISLDVTKYASASLRVALDGGTITDGVIYMEASTDGGTSWFDVAGVDSIGYNYYTSGLAEFPPTLILITLGSGNVALVVYGAGGYTTLRVRLSTVIVGTATLSLRWIGDTAPPAVQLVTVGRANQVTVQGPVADGAAADGKYPVLIAGQDGTNAQTLKTDSTGRLEPVHTQSAASTASWTSGTAQNTALSISVTQYASVLWTTTRDAGTLTDGTYITEGSLDGGTTWFLVDHINLRNNWGPVPRHITGFTTDHTATNSTYGFTANVSNLTNFRLRLDTVIAGTATMSVRIVASTTATFVMSQAPYDANSSYAVSGWDDSDNQRVLRVDSTGNLTPGGKDGDGNPPTINPILVAGDDGTNVQTLKTDSTGRLEVIDGGQSITVDNGGTFAVQPAGSVAHDGPAGGVNPALVGGYASAAAPADVSADADAVRAWYLRNGAAATVLTAAGALIGGDATNGLDTDVTRMPASKTMTQAGISTAISTNPLDISGFFQVGMQLTPTVATYTVAAQVSWDGGSTYVGTKFMAAGKPQDTISATSSSVVQRSGILLPAGVTHVRLSFSAFSAGSADVLIVASNATEQPGNYASQQPGSAVPLGVLMVGGSDGTNAQRIKTDSNGELQVDVLTLPAITGTVTASNTAGDIAHDSPDSGNPVKVGARAIAHGTNPTAVTAADRTDLLANRAGVPFVMGGHPNPVMYGMSITTAATNAIIGPTIGTGLKLVVTGLTVVLDNASTVFPSVVIGFGTATTPAFATTPGTVKVIAGHPAIPAGGGFSRGDGSGIIGVGADDEELRITTVGTAGGNGLYVLLTGYTIES